MRPLPRMQTKHVRKTREQTPRMLPLRRRLFHIIPLPLPVDALTLLSWPPQPLSPRCTSAPTVEVPPLSACAAWSSRPMTARTTAAPTSTGNAPTARVTGSNRHPGAAARGGAERVVLRHRTVWLDVAFHDFDRGLRRRSGEASRCDHRKRSPLRPRRTPTKRGRVGARLLNTHKAIRT